MRYLLLLLALSGCAQGTYWVRAHEPVAHTKTVIVDKPCGRPNLDGCNSRHTGVIELRRGMSEAKHWCVLEHEKKHLAGYNHPAAYRGFAIDCGNGEML